MPIKIFSIFATIRWQDVVDILLNSYLVFRFYVVFRGTNAFKVLVGVGVLWFIQRIAASMGLIITSWAIQGIMAAAALIVIIVFRNEIHSVLQIKQLRAILWGLPHKEVNTPIEIIIESIFDMAQKHCGALIIFPGKDDLEEVLHSGITWQGLVSKEMLLSIFWHDNPVHDGAAIVRGDRVWKVGVILPLSRRKDLPSYYGTRHRAALGLAEVTDSLVLLVSEESGNVQVAKDSQMNIVYNKKKLEQYLKEHLGIETNLSAYRKRDRFRIVFAALASILVVIGIWFSFLRGMESLITIETPIEYTNRASEMKIMDTSSDAVRLHLSGAGALIKSIRPEQIGVSLDIGDAMIGSSLYHFTPDNVRLPPGVYLRRIEPPVVEVILDMPIKRVLPIQIDWSGRLSEELILASARIKPTTIEVIGGKGILDQNHVVYTKKVLLDDIKKSGTISMGLALNPTFLKLPPGIEDGVIIKYVVKKRRDITFN